MREIKFRGFYKEAKSFIYSDDYDFIDLDDNCFCDIIEGTPIRTYTEDLQQFTGLKDKNGKEIYEGDILGGLYDGGYISWCEKCKQFQYFGCKDECFACGGDVHWFELLVEEELEVIGNIHENPELIN